SDGTRTASALSASVIGSASHRRYLLVFPDMTQKREVERSRQSFVAMVTGELRSPLKQLQSFFLELQENRCNDMSEQALEHAQLSFASSTRMLRLVNDVLDFEFVNQGNFELSRKNADLK